MAYLRKNEYITYSAWIAQIIVVVHTEIHLLYLLKELSSSFK